MAGTTGPSAWGQRPGLSHAGRPGRAPDSEAQMEIAEARRNGKPWTFLTNHARVLICIARDPELRVRDVADRIGITERAAQLIITDLEEAGYLVRTRVGRRNTYTINADRPFRHPAEAGHDVQDLIEVFLGEGSYA
ncbi:winged helix-turn-helix domain-containing protein [Actinomadura sp. NPDC048394]|uniref:helix-turn-helix transcriptional regulator n=1 Tax=Actinomadura sp. NPDC048394 TaxID=3158223 RepID=UPI0033C5A5E6